MPSQLSPKWPVLTLKMRELRHWPSIAGMSPQSHCGDEEDGRIGLSSWRHYIYVLCSLLCACWALCVCHEPISVRFEHSVCLGSIMTTWAVARKWWAMITQAQFQYLMMIGRDGGLSTLCHSCRFDCQQRVLKTFLALTISAARTEQSI